jgi:hypothetical protein
MINFVIIKLLTVVILQFFSIFATIIRADNLKLLQLLLRVVRKIDAKYVESFVIFTPFSVFICFKLENYFHLREKEREREIVSLGILKV